MAPKKKSKGELSKEQKELLKKQREEEKFRADQERLREKQEREEKEAVLRSQVILASRKAFEAVSKAVSQKTGENLEASVWEKYLDTYQKPSPRNPAQLREYVTKWFEFEREEDRQVFDSWLYINEQSLLNQDEDSKDMTFGTFIKGRKPVGAKFCERIQEVLEIEKDIREVLANEGPCKDLAKFHAELRRTLMDYIDKWSYQILSRISTEMIDLSPISSEYVHSSNPIKQYLWCFKAVPLPPDYFQENRIKMRNLDSEFINSNELDLQGSAIRGLWLNFDHLSDLVPSFETPKVYPQDFGDYLESAQSLEATLRLKKLENMKDAREKYEEKMRNKSEEAGSSKKGSGKEKPAKRAPSPKKKKKSAEAEPPVVTSETRVDVSEDLEKLLWEEFLDSNSIPAPKLNKHEMNLRRFQCQGGVFSFNLIKRPSQPKMFADSYVFRIVDHADVLELREFYAPYDEIKIPPMKEPSGDFENELMAAKKRKEYQQRAEEEERMINEENAIRQRKMILLKIRLPKGVYWWKPPQICRWEPWEDSDEFKSLSPGMQDFNKNYEKLLELQLQKLFSPPEYKPSFKGKTVPDFAFDEIPRPIHSHSFVKHYLIPRMPSNYKFRVEIEQEKREKRIQALELRKKQFQIQREEQAREAQLQLEERSKYAEKYDLDLSAEVFEKLEPDPCLELSVSSLESEGSLYSANAIKMSGPVAKAPEKVIVEDTPPSFLFPKNQKLRPLTVIGTGGQLPRFSGTLDENRAKLSQFLSHLDTLREKEEPFFHSESYIEARLAEVKDVESTKASEETARRSSNLRSGCSYSARRVQLLGKKPTSKKPRRKSKIVASKGSSVTFKESKEEQEIELEEVDMEEEKLLLVPHAAGSWSKRDVHCEMFDQESQVLSFRSSCFGTFGLFSEKYLHFPLKSWKMSPVGANQVDLTLVTQFTKLVFEVSAEGFTAGVFLKKAGGLEDLVSVVPEAIPLKDLIEVLRAVNLNMFPEPDAGQFIDPKSEKLEPLEVHNLRCLSLFCQTHEFRSSPWNILANYSSLLLGVCNLEEDVWKEVLVTPLKAEYVLITEQEGDDGALQIIPDPPKQILNFDMRSLLLTDLSLATKKTLSETSYLLQWNVGEIISAMKLFSFA